MVVELVILACMTAQPDRCEAFREPFQEQIQMPQCVWQSQLRAAQWAGAHPDWVVKKVSCEAPEV